jgi:hypothetical protein
MGVIHRFRDAVTGEYRPEHWAERHPRRSVQETDTGVRRAARELLAAYDADDTGNADSYADRFEALRATLR